MLWLTHTPAGASKQLNVNDPGRGWIGSLETAISNVPGIELGVCFFSDQKGGKFMQNSVAYYPMAFKYSSRSGKIYQRLTGALYDSNTEGIREAIADFKPDVIHLFGTESGVGEVVHLTDIPVVVHIQGLVNPYLYAWLPKGISQSGIAKASSLRAKLFRRGLYFEYPLFKKRADRETEIISKAKYFFGRTSWDHNYLKLCKSSFNYFHCEEVLRPLFYQVRWQRQVSQVFKITTIINPQIYKGLEMVLAAAKLLKDSKKLAFEWNIIGMDRSHELVSIVENLLKDRFADYNVIFKGAKSGEDLITNLQSSNLFVHPSHIDNSPNSVCEAMIIGMPVLAGFVGGIPSLIQDQETGILYNSNDPYELAYKILAASENSDLLEKISEKARKTALERHQVENIVDTVYSTYKLVIEKEKVKYEQHGQQNDSSGDSNLQPSGSNQKRVAVHQ